MAAEFPTFYDPRRIGTLFYPDLARIAAEAEAAGLSPAALDTRTVHLVIVDMQVDFCHKEGSLHVPGALADLQRTIEFIYRNAGRITRITASLDSHLPSQIFSPGWWVDNQDEHPAPFTLITLQDAQAGRWRAVHEPERSLAYLQALEREAKKQLTIWPYHVLTGSIGHALDPELWSAIFWHSLARQSQPTWLVKGSVPLTEHYSIVRPEVPMPEQAGGGTNQAFVDALAEADEIVVVGEAASHCVLETLEDIVEEFAGQPERLRRIRVLRDATSPVQHPEVDFTALAQARLADFERQGVRLASSTDPL